MTPAGDGSWDGLLRVDKPEGPTSHDIVARIRKRTGTRRVGHSGTLDPPASGLLLVAVGRATRLIRFLPQAPKLYVGELRLGAITSTDDAEGEILERYDGPLPPDREVVAAAATFVGEGLQRPPAISARKIDGERMYKRARRGEVVVAEAKPVQIDTFRLEPMGDGRFRYSASVSAGTYVRSLARDLGERLGCGGHILRLRRLSIGALGLDRAVDPAAGPDDPQWRAAWTPLERLPLDLPEARVAGALEERLFRSGVVLESDRFTAPEGCAFGSGESGFFKIVAADGGLAGVAEAADGRMRPTVVLPA